MMINDNNNNITINNNNNNNYYYYYYYYYQLFVQADSNHPIYLLPVAKHNNNVATKTSVMISADHLAPKFNPYLTNQSVNSLRLMLQQCEWKLTILVEKKVIIITPL